MSFITFLCGMLYCCQYCIFCYSKHIFCKISSLKNKKSHFFPYYVVGIINVYWIDEGKLEIKFLRDPIIFKIFTDQYFARFSKIVLFSVQYLWNQKWSGKANYRYGIWRLSGCFRDLVCWIWTRDSFSSFSFKIIG